MNCGTRDNQVSVAVGAKGDQNGWGERGRAIFGSSISSHWYLLDIKNLHRQDDGGTTDRATMRTLAKTTREYGNGRGIARTMGTESILTPLSDSPLENQQEADNAKSQELNCRFQHDTSFGCGAILYRIPLESRGISKYPAYARTE